MKTFVYARVSTERQDLQQQMNAINDYLKLKGLKIDEIVSDEGVSGGVSYKKRKLMKLINDMSEGDALVVSEISRLGRSMSDLNKLVNDELKPRKLRLIIISMGLDLDCSNLKAIDEMILFAFGFSAQIEKEMIQERTTNALDARKKSIEKDGFFISKRGRVCKKLGSPKGFTHEAWEASARNKKIRARENPTNLFFYRFIKQFEERNGKLSKESSKEVFQQIANELNSLGQKTVTGLDYTALRARSCWNKMVERYKE